MVVVGLGSDRQAKKSTVQGPFSIDSTRTGSKLYWFSVWVVFCSFKFFSTATFFSLSSFLSLGLIDYFLTRNRAGNKIELGWTCWANTSRMRVRLLIDGLFTQFGIYLD